VEPHLTLDSIESPFTGKKLLNWRNGFLDYLNTDSEVTNLGKCMKSKKSLHNYLAEHISFAAGPLGSPAILTASADAIALVNWDKFQVFSSYLEKLGLSSITRQVIEVERWHRDQSFSWRFSKSISSAINSGWNGIARIIAIPAPAGKTRNVYILNYFLQSCMKALHDSIFKWLKTIPQDCTFDQGAGVHKLKQLTAEKQAVWCYDLTAATDRIPLWIQLAILRKAFGKHWAGLARLILTIKPFSTDINREVSWRVGQPMGAYASFGCLAIWHHFILRYCCSLASTKSYPYQVLGDDVFIYNETVARNYLQICKDLGIEISQGKSITPEHLNPEISSGEFAKHLVNQGLLLSPISLATLNEIFFQNKFFKIIDLAFALEGQITEDLLIKQNQRLSLSAPLQILFNEISNIKQLTIVRSLYPLEVFTRPIPFKRIQTEQTNVDVDSLQTKKDHESFSPTTLERIPVQMYCNHPDQWENFNSMQILYAKLEIIEKQLSDNWTKVSNLLKLEDPARHAGSLEKGLNYRTQDILSLEVNPLYLLFKRSEKTLKGITSSIANGEIPDDFVDSIIEAEFITSVVSGAIPYQTYLDKKSRRSDYAVRFSEQLWKALHG
jgi:hypothetical protein